MNRREWRNAQRASGRTLCSSVMRNDMPDKNRNAQLYDAYDADRPLLARCACGGDRSPADRQAPHIPRCDEEIAFSFLEAAIPTALFPHKPAPRALRRIARRRT